MSSTDIINGPVVNGYGKQRPCNIVTIIGFIKFPTVDAAYNEVCSNVLLDVELNKLLHYLWNFLWLDSGWVGGSIVESCDLFFASHPLSKVDQVRSLVELGKWSANSLETRMLAEHVNALTNS